jgi:transcriptional regulator with XRE-family HTH domain
MPYPLYQHVYPEIVRIRVTPDEPAEGPPAITPARPSGSRRPHNDMTVAKVRDLIERTALTYDQITAKTGVCAASISNWTRGGKWVRPPDAARPWDSLPAYRASRRLKLRKLAGRLRSLAERYVRELEATPGVDVDTLMQALQVLRMTRREAMGNKRRLAMSGRPQTGREYHDREQAIRTALKEMLPRGNLRPQLHAPMVRLGDVPPDKPAAEPPAIMRARPPGSRRPHSDMTYAGVRELIEHTALSYEQIQARTGLNSCTISCWARDGGWVRPLEAPRSSDRMPTFRARRRLKLRKLAGRLQMLAEHAVRKLEETPGVDLDRLIQALQVLRMARLEAMGNRRRGPWPREPRTAAWTLSREQAIGALLKEMRRGGVDIDRAPKEALELLIEAKVPVDDDPAFRDRTPRSRRDPEHAQVLWPNGRGKWRAPGATRPPK